MACHWPMYVPCLAQCYFCIFWCDRRWSKRRKIASKGLLLNVRCPYWSQSTIHFCPIVWAWTFATLFSLLMELITKSDLPPNDERTRCSVLHRIRLFTCLSPFVSLSLSYFLSLSLTLSFSFLLSFTTSVHLESYFFSTQKYIICVAKSFSTFHAVLDSKVVAASLFSFPMRKKKVSISLMQRTKAGISRRKNFSQKTNWIPFSFLKRYYSEIFSYTLSLMVVWNDIVSAAPIIACLTFILYIFLNLFFSSISSLSPCTLFPSKINQSRVSYHEAWRSPLDL